MSSLASPCCATEGRPRRRPLRLACALLFCCAGCTYDQLNPFKPPPPPPPPVESFILQPTRGLVPEPKPDPKTPEGMLAGAHELFRREEYDKAERVFHYLADNSSNSPTVRQEAYFYDAECLRMTGDYPKAADVYAKLQTEFVYNPYREQAVQRMYEIAYYWLQDTWEEMKEYTEYKEGKRWAYLPRFVSFEKKKPILDREGRAKERLKDVSTYDGKGPYADKALYMLGRVALYNEDYHEADASFTKLYTEYPQSKYADEALQRAIYCKALVMGGPDYDGTKVAEARKLVDAGLRMPGLSVEAKRKLSEQLKSINLQQATQDFKKAEFYDRTGHPGAAYFQYEIVRRRYAGTPLAEQAGRRMQELYAAAAKDQGSRSGGESSAPAPKTDAPPAVGGDPSQMSGAMNMGTSR